MTRSCEIMTLNSPGGNTLQCGRWLWDDMPWDSPKRSPYWNSTSASNFNQPPHSTCHSASVSEILSKSDHPRYVMSIFKMADLSHLGFLGSNNGLFEKPNYNLLSCLVFEKIAFLHIGVASTSKMADLRHLGF